MSQLSDFPLAELLRELALQQQSGAVRLELERARAVVYLESGNPVFAATNVKDLRLGEYLVRHGLLSREDLSRLQNLPDTALGKELTSKNLLDSSALKQASGALVNDILRVLLLWTNGTWEYDPRARLADSFRTSVETPSLLLAAARKMDTKFIASRFGDKDEVISPAVDATMVHNLLPEEGFLLSRLERPMPLGELVSLSGQPEEEALKTIYGLAVSGCLKRDSWPVSLKSGGRVEQRPVKPVEVEPPSDTDEEQLERFFIQVETANTHYQVLDTTTNTPVDEIKRAYYGLARRYHPDRFHGNVQIHRRIESAFARITQAYEVLTDPALRTKYDNRLAAQEKVRTIADTAPKAAPNEDGTVTPQTTAQQSAEMNFREGYAALQMAQLTRALTNLAAAANSAPNEPRYRAYYGKALAASSKTQRMAETEFQAAIRLEPNNAAYHLMLAQLYYDLTFFKRARAEAARALELDPKHPDAKALLRKMEDK